MPLVHVSASDLGACLSSPSVLAGFFVLWVLVPVGLGAVIGRIMERAAARGRAHDSRLASLPGPALTTGKLPSAAVKPKRPRKHSATANVPAIVGVASR